MVVLSASQEPRTINMVHAEDVETMQALNDSGLGEALIGGGLMDELRQPVFSVGLKGVDPANADKVCALLHALCSRHQLQCSC